MTVTDSPGYAEYAVAKKAEGKNLLLRILLITLYVSFALAYFIFFTAVIPIVMLIALLPLFVWMLVFFTWRYVSLEYKYTVESGVFTLYTVYGAKKQKKLCELRLRDAKRILPVSEFKDEIAAFSPSVIFDGRASKDVSDDYAILYYEDDKPAVIYVDAPEQSVKVFHYYNPDNTVRILKK